MSALPSHSRFVSLEGGEGAGKTTVLGALRRALAADGDEVLVTREPGGSPGAEAIRKAKEMKPDLIFMDVVMPGVNGFQATRKLASDPDTKAIPVIMVTTKDQETDSIWGMRQGAKDYLAKPVSMEKLIEKAQAALAG